MFGVYIVVGWLVVGTIVLIVFYHQKTLKMTSTTLGSVLSATNREVRTVDSRRDETIVIAEFVAAGQVYRITHIVPGRNADRFPAGTKLPLRYNPGDPRMSTVQRA